MPLMLHFFLPLESSLSKTPPLDLTQVILKYFQFSSCTPFSHFCMLLCPKHTFTHTHFCLGNLSFSDEISLIYNIILVLGIKDNDLVYVYMMK